MTFTFRVRPHPLGVVVYDQPCGRGELLIENESCCGIPFEELARIAATTGEVAVPDEVARKCPLWNKPPG